MEAIDELGETGQHAGHLHRRRQRREPRGRHGGRRQRDGLLQRRARAAGRAAEARDELGGPDTYAALRRRLGDRRQHAVPVRQAGGVDAGGNQNRMVIRWPKRIKARGELRIAVPPRDRHRADRAGGGRAAAAHDRERHRAAPDGGREPAVHVRRREAPTGTPRSTSRSAATAACITTAGSPARCTARPGRRSRAPSSTNDTWELYDVAEDFSQSNDLAASNPAKLKELQALFLTEAAKYQVLPIDDRSVERMDPAVAGRPDLMGGRTSLTLYPGGAGWRRTRSST